MPDLARFQELFVDGLTATTPMPGIFASSAFAVYRNTWRKALIDALRDTFPVVSALVGPEAFQALALEFIGRQAAPSPILAAFGAGFDGFIEAHAISDQLRYLANVARLERLWTEAHLAADAEPIDRDRFLQRLGGGMEHVLKLHASVRFAWFETPAVTIWQAHQAPGGFSSLAPDWVCEGALIVRRAGRVRVERIGRETYRLLCEIRAGQCPLQAGEAIDESGCDGDVLSTLLRLAGSEALTEE